VKEVVRHAGDRWRRALWIKHAQCLLFQPEARAQLRADARIEPPFRVAERDDLREAGGDFIAMPG
jgi:hypothetical protein